MRLNEILSAFITNNPPKDNSEQVLPRLQQMIRTARYPDHLFNRDEYLRLLALVRFAIDIEQEHMPADKKMQLALESAFKLIAVFATYDQAVSYLKAYDSQQVEDENLNEEDRDDELLKPKQLIHDACLFHAPQGAGLNLELWRGIIRKNPPNGPHDKQMRLLQRAKDLEDYVHAHRIEWTVNLRLKLQDEFPEQDKASRRKLFKKVKLQAEAFLASHTPLATLIHYAAQIQYKHAAKNPEAAALFCEHNLAEAVFEKYLSIIPLEQGNQIPELVVDGASFGNERFLIRKLSPTDPRAAILGVYTSSCQSLGDAAESVTIHGMTSPYGGFYVLVDKETDAIQAQCWAWLNGEGIIVFDSIEARLNFRKKHSGMITAGFLQLANQLVKDHQATAVHIGIGGNTPSALTEGSLVAITPVRPVDHEGYSDSTIQIIAAHQQIPTCFLRGGILDENTANNLKQYPLSEKTAKLLIAHLNFNQVIFQLSQKKLGHIMPGLKMEPRALGLTSDEFNRYYSVLSRYVKTLPLLLSIHPRSDLAKFRSGCHDLIQAISCGVDPLFHILGLNIFHYFGSYGNEADIKTLLHEFAPKDSIALVKTHMSFTSVLHVAAYNEDPGVISTLLSLYPPEQRLAAMKQVDIEGVPPIRKLLAGNQNQAVFHAVMALLSEADRLALYLDTSKENLMLYYARQNCELMLDAVLEYCPKEMLTHLDAHGVTLLNLLKRKTLKYEQMQSAERGASQQHKHRLTFKAALEQIGLFSSAKISRETESFEQARNAAVFN